MAATTQLSQTKQELASMLVQEIAKKGDEIPEFFLRKDGFPEAIEAPELWKDKLLIDFSLLSSASSSELAKLRSALSQWGCFQVINHGIESSFLEELIDVSKQFFALPLEEKLKYSAEDDLIEGYGTDSRFSGTQAPPSWNDRIFVTLYPKEKLRLECWPQKPQKFRGMMVDYAKKLTALNKDICKAMARSLSLEENSLDWGKQGPSIGRFNLYPRCPDPEHVLGTKPHTDGSKITYLLPEEDEGLHVLNDDQWYKVTVIPGALFINFGDLGEVITNGVFKSAMHRVGTNMAKERISVVVFFTADSDEEIGPLSDLVRAHQPQVYKKFNMTEYLERFYESFKKGSRALDAFRM